MSEACRFCGRESGLPCRSTRDMEDAGDDTCRTALMVSGGGEYTANRVEAEGWRDLLVGAHDTDGGRPVALASSLPSDPVASARVEALARAGFATVEGDRWTPTAMAAGRLWVPGRWA